MPIPPQSTRTSLEQRLSSHARKRWPHLASLDVRFRGQFAYVAARFADDDPLPLCRLRYNGSAHDWGFAIYRASHEDSEDNFLPSGLPYGSAEEALDCAGGLYLGEIPAPMPTKPLS
ncbi:MAG: hypothetical protein ACRDG3_13235 [Tepidiformaceae bacterium]